jgi:hypothetical protein
MNRRQLENLAHGMGFPPGLWCTDGDGLLGTYDASGRLVSLQWHYGTETGTLQFTLNPRARSGELFYARAAGASEDRETYRNGQAEQFDAWSDNLRPSPMTWRQWTRRGATRLLGVCRCSLCGTSIAEKVARAHSQDQRHMLCSDCWSAVSQEDPTPRLWPLGDRRCALCDTTHADSSLLHEGPHGKLCVPCVKEMNPVPLPSLWQRVLRHM